VVELHAATPVQLPLLAVVVGPELADLVVVETGATVVVGVVEPTGHDCERTVVIHELPTSGNCQAIAPEVHPELLACDKQPARVDGSMYPLFASDVVPGLPMTILERSTPAVEWIWNTALLGKVDDEVVRRPEQVVYSEVP